MYAADILKDHESVYGLQTGSEKQPVKYLFLIRVATCDVRIAFICFFIFFYLLDQVSVGVNLKTGCTIGQYKEER